MPRTDKITRILSLYYQLLTGKPINKQSFCAEHGITERSFDRDIEDVRLFLSEEQSYCELHYDRQNNVYNLTNTLGKYIPGEISFLLVDVLFSMKMISKGEMEGILISLLEVTELQKSKELYDYIIYNFNLKSHWENVAVLKMHKDLESVISAKKLIEINYEINEDNTEKRKIYPVQLKIDNGYIYLIAYIADKKYKNPAFFRLDRIRSFTILQEHFIGDIQGIYLEKTKHKDLYSMMEGEEVEVTVRVCYDMRKVLCEVFPTSRIMDTDNENYYIYKIKTNKQGFLSWILGQEREVVILEPEKLKDEVISRMRKNLSMYEGEV